MSALRLLASGRGGFVGIKGYEEPGKVEVLGHRVEDGIEQVVFRYFRDTGLMFVEDHKATMEAKGFTGVCLTLEDRHGCVQYSYTRDVE